MKKSIIVFILFSITIGLWAQEQSNVVTHDDLEKKIAFMTGADIPKGHYLNFSYATQELKHDAYDEIPAQNLKSDQSFAFEYGVTYFFNPRRPVANMIRFGLDVSWIDLQYASFIINGTDEDNRPVKTNSHFINAGIQIGPSITVTPKKGFNIKAYGRYAPSGAFFAPSDFSEFKGGYAGYITGGIQASYKVITLGIEMRSATADLSTVNTSSISENINGGGLPNLDDITDDIFGPKVKTKLPGLRFIVGFRF